MTKKIFIFSYFLLLFCFCIFRSFVWEKIATKSLYDFDEARYAEVAKNILKTNNWLIPMASGPDDHQSIKLFQLPNTNWLSPYFWKPPLHPVVVAVFFKIFGISELSLRLPSLIFSLLSLIIIFSLSRTLFPKSNIFSHFLASTIFAISNDYSYLSSQGLSDSQLLFLLLLSVYFITKKRLILSAIFFSLAFLTKSFATLWFIPFIFIHITYTFRSLKPFILWILVSTILILPWHLYMYSLFGQIFIDNYLIINTIGRAGGITQNIAPIHWYTIYALDKWKNVSFILLPLLLSILLNSKKYWLPISWFIICFIFFSLPQSKVWWYVYPIWPAVTIIISQALFSQIFHNKISCLLLLIFSLLPFLPYWQLTTHHIPIKEFALLALATFIFSIALLRFKSNILFKYIGIITIFIFIFSTLFFTYRSSQNRPDFNASIKNLSQLYPDIIHLSVSGLPYESALFYFDTGTISRQITSNTTHLLTIENNQPVIRILDQTDQTTK